MKENVNNIDLAWAAGFFDGEGCVMICKRTKAHAVRITVSQVDPRPILRFKSMFGGHISKQVRQNPNWKDQWKWEQDSKSGVATLELLLPYLCVKKEVAELAIAFQKTKKRTGIKITDEAALLEVEFKQRISALNQAS